MEDLLVRLAAAFAAGGFVYLWLLSILDSDPCWRDPTYHQFLRNRGVDPLVARARDRVGNRIFAALPTVPLLPLAVIDWLRGA